MGKPSETGEPRPTGLRLTPEANQGLKALAAVNGLSKQSYLERLIRREVQAERIKLRPVQARPA
jgi:predicted DNA-binding protein